MFGAPNQESRANEQLCLFIRCVLRVWIASSTMINEHGVNADPKRQITHLENVALQIGMQVFTVVHSCQVL